MDQFAGLPEHVRKLALDRFRLLQPHLEQSQSLQSIAQAAGIPYRTAQRWVAQLSAVRPGRAGSEEARGSRHAARRLSEGSRMSSKGLPSKGFHFQLQRCTVRCSESLMTWVRKRRATGRSSISSACLVAGGEVGSIGEFIGLYSQFVE